MSLTSIESKVLQDIVHGQVMKHLEQYKILSRGGFKVRQTSRMTK